MPPHWEPCQVSAGLIATISARAFNPFQLLTEAFTYSAHSFASETRRSNLVTLHVTFSAGFATSERVTSSGLPVTACFHAVTSTFETGSAVVVDAHQSIANDEHGTQLCPSGECFFG